MTSAWSGSDRKSPGSSSVPKERRAPRKCPTAEENCTESDWSFFVAEWGRYVAAVGLKDEEHGTV